MKKWTSFRFNLLDGISKRIAQTRMRRTYIPGPSYVAFFQLAFLVWFTIVGQSWSLIRIESVPKTGLPKNQEKLFFVFKFILSNQGRLYGNGIWKDSSLINKIFLFTTSLEWMTKGRFQKKVWNFPYFPKATNPGVQS